MINGKRRMKMMKAETEKPMSMLWLVDTGCTDSVASHEYIGPSPVRQEPFRLPVTTAQGTAFITQSTLIEFRKLCRTAMKVYLLPNCPPALAANKLCYDFGCSMIWVGNTYDCFFITQDETVIGATFINGCPYIEDPFELCDSIGRSLGMRDSQGELLLSIVRTLQQHGPMVHVAPSCTAMMATMGSQEGEEEECVMVLTKEAQNIIDADPQGRAPERHACTRILTLTEDFNHVIKEISNPGFLQHMCDDPINCSVCVQHLRMPLPEAENIVTVFYFKRETPVEIEPELA